MIACGERAGRGYSTLLAVALAATLTACGSSSADSPAATARQATEPVAPATTSTTRPAPTTTTPTTSTTMPPYSFDGSVPAPELVNTGDDYEAIAKSLLGYIAWLKRHNPDPELLDEVIVNGTDVYRRARDNIAALMDQGFRYYDVDQQFEVDVVTVDGDRVSCLVGEQLAAEQLIDSEGRVLEERRSQGRREEVLLLMRGATGRWRIAAITPSTRNAEVRL